MTWITTSPFWNTQFQAVAPVDAHAGLVRADHTGAAQAGENGARPRHRSRGLAASEGRVQRTFADRQPEQFQHQPAQPPVADRMHDAQIHRQRHDVEAERRARLQTLRHRRQRDAAAAAALRRRSAPPASPPARPAAGRSCRSARQASGRPPPAPPGSARSALAARSPSCPGSATSARPPPLRPRLPLRGPCRCGFSAGWLLALRRRHAGVVRRLRRQPKPGLQFRHPRRQRLNLRPQRSDQRVLLVMRQAAEIRKLGHPKLESRQPGSRQAAILQPDTPLRTQGDEQIRAGAEVLCLLMQGWLVVLELYDQVDLDISTGFECLLWQCRASSVTRWPARPSWPSREVARQIRTVR